MATESGVGSVGTVRPDLMVTATAARPTPKPARVSFGEVLAAGASVAVDGAQTALSKLPGSPVSAPGVRGPQMVNDLAMNAEGPTAVSSLGATSLGASGVSIGGVSVGGSSSGSSGTGSSDINTMLNQQAQQNEYYLQLQMAEDAQSRQFTTLSDVEKENNDTEKAAINNIGQ